MGLKSGSRDTGLDESEEEQRTDGVEEEQPTDVVEDTQPEPPAHARNNSTDTKPTHSSLDSIPYKLRRSNVNEGREQVPYFLRPSVIEGEDELQRTLEDALGETVYKSDYREAAMIVAQRNPELIEEVLREWGYDLQID